MKNGVGTRKGVKSKYRLLAIKNKSVILFSDMNIADS